MPNNKSGMVRVFSDKFEIFPFYFKIKSSGTIDRDKMRAIDNLHLGGWWTISHKIENGFVYQYLMFTDESDLVLAKLLVG